MYSNGCATVDPLGFTKQTETILCGLGGDNLLSEFKKRNISTGALHELTKEDFLKLGADDRTAEHMMNELKVMQRNIKLGQTSHEDRVNDFLYILEHGHQHLSLLQAFIVYSRLRLTNEQINLFIDYDRNIRASEALYIGALITLDEINDAEQAVKELDNFISEMNGSCKDEAGSKYSCIKYSALTTTIIAVAYTVFLTYRYYRRV